MKWLAIFNPRAGYRLPGDGHGLSDQIQRQIGADVAWTRSRKDAWHLVKRNGHYDGFLGIGYLAGATAVAELPFKRWGPWVYGAAAVIQSFRQSEFLIELRIDEGPVQQLALTTLIVNNTPFIGHFRMFPEASVQDGKLNVLYGRHRPGSQLLEDLGVVTETYLFERARHLAARQVEVALAVPGTLMVDGDLIAEVERVRFEALSGRLRCCTAHSAPRIGALATQSGSIDRFGRNAAPTRNPLTMST